MAVVSETEQTTTRTALSADARAARRRQAFRQVTLAVVGVIVALVVWHFLAVQQGFALPGPIDAASDINENFWTSEYLAQKGLSDGAGYISHLAFTTRNVLVGVIIGAALGITLGLVSMRVRMVSEIVNPLAAAFGAAPIFVAAPFFLIWFGIQATAQVAMVAFYTTILMYVFSRRAGDNLEAGYVESALTLGGTARSIFRWVYLPGTVPEILGGLRIALAGAWGLAAIAELLGAQQGAGFLIKFFATAYVVDGMIALVVLLGLIAIAVDRLLVLGGKYLTRWSESGRRLSL